MTIYRCTALTLLTLLMVPVAPVAAQSAPQPAPLLLFGNQPPRGLFRVDFVSSDDPLLRGRVQSGRGPSICMDPAQAVTAAAPFAGAPTCTSKTLQNTRTLAQFESTCSNGRVTRTTVTREADNVFAFTSVESGGADAPKTTKGRYHYEGPCPEGSGAPGRVQVDKNSAQCQQLRASMGSTTLESTCGQAPAGEARDACIKQMEPLFKVLKSCD